MILARATVSDDGRMAVRAAIWDGPGRRCRSARCPTPACPEDGVLLRVTACGICGTDVRSFYNGDRRIEPPWVLGHEISRRGDRDRAARRARGRRERHRGRRRACTASRRCGAAAAACAAAATSTSACNGELMGFDYQGAYAELRGDPPDRAARTCSASPTGLSAAHATFADPLSDAICGHKDIAIGLDDAVAVIGAGPVGTAHAALARLQGAGQVLLLETAAQPARRWPHGDPRRRPHGVRRHVERRRRHRRGARARPTEFGADVVIVACSSDIAQEQAMEMAAPRGRVLFFGGLPKGTTHMRFPSNILHYQEVQVHGSYASRHRDQVRGARHAGRRRGRHPLGRLARSSALDEAPGRVRRASAPARC